MSHLTIIGSHYCPDVLYSVVKCKELGIAVTFIDVSGSLHNLKVFLALYANDPVYAEIRKSSVEPDYPDEGTVGIPCFVFDDGFKTLNLDEALQRLKVDSQCA